jgi:hypothetical protein
MKTYLAVVLLLALSLGAQAKPNFGGTWKLDTAKSDFGPMPPPSSMTREIRHDEPSLQIKTTTATQQGEITAELKYTTDGKPSTNSTRMGEVKGTAQWEGDTLVIRYTISSPQLGDMKFEDRWALSSTGKVTTVDTKISGGFGESSRRLHFDRQ